MSAPEKLDPRQVDATYRGIPRFAEWAKLTVEDASCWQRYRSELDELAKASPELLGRAREVAKRAAAVDTGAIEGLYEVDRGFTFSVALQLAAWEAKLDAKGPRVRSLIEAQMSAYDFVLDLATRREPLSEAWIRKLHEVVCAGQTTFTAHTEVGVQEQQLPLGAYKRLPNHVRRADGSTHAYAPVDLVPEEMHRLMLELRTPEFEVAHPALQAAYAHYTFVVIHPFADDNGRVSRALASVFTYRTLRVPVLILSEHRSEYFDALEQADGGSFEAFVPFIGARILDSIQLVSDTLRAAGGPGAEATAASFKSLYRTKGGFTHGEVDAAGERLFSGFTEELERQRRALVSEEAAVSWEFNSSRYSVDRLSYRPPVTPGPRSCLVTASSRPPGQASVAVTPRLEVPRDPDGDDDIIIRGLDAADLFSVRLNDAHPVLRATVQLRIAVFVQGLIARLLVLLKSETEKVLRRNGY